MDTDLTRTPLLVGQRPYGALETLPLLSGYASSVDRGVDSDLEDLADENEHPGPSPSAARHETDEEYTDRSHIVRRISVSMDSVMLGHISPDGPAEGVLGREGASWLNEDSDEDYFDEKDPPDNSPCVTYYGLSLEQDFRE